MLGRTVIRLGLVVAMGVGLAACGEAGDDAADADDPSGREWVLQELSGGAVAGDAMVTLLIDEGQISGSSGCNRYVGAVDLAERSLMFESEIARTMMACPDELMELEEAYLAALATVADWSMADDTLILLDDAGDAVAVFS